MNHSTHHENHDSPGSTENDRTPNPEEILEKLYDPSYLPTHEEIAYAFRMGEYSPHAADQWNNFCFSDEHSVYEIITVESVEALSNYLVARAHEMGASQEHPLVVLEIGAGDGRLTHFLSASTTQKAGNLIRVIATDSGDWDIRTQFPVEKMDHNRALRKYQPEVVVLSWMPFESDLTPDIRACESVKEYLLIGEYDDRLDVPGYDTEGFTKETLKDISRTQICATDDRGRYHHSSTVSFKRVE